MGMISQEGKGRLDAAIGNVESSVAALGQAYRELLAAYDAGRTEAFREGGSHYASNVASTIGPDRFHEDIVRCMLHHGLAPLFERTAMAADAMPIESLAAAFGARVAGV